MAAKIPTAWRDTPATSERIVSAISRIGAALRAGAWEFATAQGLNRTQVEVLEILNSRDAGVRLSWLAQQLQITAATVSDSVAALVAKELVQKKPAVDDGRAIAVQLTAAGRALAGKIGHASDFAIDAIEKLPPATQQRLFTSLLAVIGELQRSDHFGELRACVTCEHFAANAHRSAQAPHHCRLVDAPLSPSLLRFDCPDHRLGDPLVVRKNWLLLKSA